MTLLIVCATFLLTLLGGFFALRFRDKLHIILGFSAGAIIGVAFFDLLPEALELAEETHSVEFIMSTVALGFLLYLFLDRLIFTHSHSHGHSGQKHDDIHGDPHAHDVGESAHQRTSSRKVGGLALVSLILHSLLDGVAIGVAFHVSTHVGLSVALAVLVHDFSDGISVVGVALKNGISRTRLYQWLVLGALAPVVGFLSTSFYTFSAGSLGVTLALFSGFFLYIGASELLPESHHSHPTRYTTIFTILGIVLIYLVSQLGHI